MIGAGFLLLAVRLSRPVCSIFLRDYVLAGAEVPTTNGLMNHFVQSTHDPQWAFAQRSAVFLRCE